MTDQPDQLMHIYDKIVACPDYAEHEPGSRLLAALFSEIAQNADGSKFARATCSPASYRPPPSARPEAAPRSFEGGSRRL